MASRFRSLYDPEAQDALEAVPVAPERPPIDVARAQTLARSSSNPQAQKQGNAMLEERSRQQQSAARAAQVEQNKAAREAERTAAEAAREQEAIRARGVREAAARGAKIETDTSTGKRKVTTHPNGQPMSEAGPVGKPFLRPTAEAAISSIPGMGGFASLTRPVDRQRLDQTQEVAQEFRDDSFNTVVQPLPSDTDPKTGAITGKLKDEFGAPQTVQLGTDQGVQAKVAKDADLELRRQELALRTNRVDQDKKRFTPQWDAVEKPYNLTKSALEKIQAKPFRRNAKGEWEKFDPDTNLAIPVAFDKRNESKAEIAFYEASLKDAQIQHSAAKAKYEKLVPFSDNLKRNDEEIEAARLKLTEEKILHDSGIKADAPLPSFTSEGKEKALAELSTAKPTTVRLKQQDGSEADVPLLPLQTQDGQSIHIPMVDEAGKKLTPAQALDQYEAKGTHVKLDSDEDESATVSPFTRKLANMDIEAARVQSALSTGKADAPSADKRLQVLAEVKGQTLNQAKAEAKARLDEQGREIASQFIGTGIEAQKLSGNTPGTYATAKGSLNEAADTRSGVAKALEMAGGDIDQAIKFANREFQDIENAANKIPTGPTGFPSPGAMSIDATRATKFSGAAESLTKMKAAMDAAGIPPEDRADAIQDAAKIHAWTENDTDNLRQLKSGDLVINPARVFGQKDALIAAINASKASPAQKKAAVARLDAMRKAMAEQTHEAIVKGEQLTDKVLGGIPQFTEKWTSADQKFKTDYDVHVAAKAKEGITDKAELIDSYMAEKDSRWMLTKLYDALGTGIASGAVGIGKTGVGIAASAFSITDMATGYGSGPAASLGQKQVSMQGDISAMDAAGKTRGLTGGFVIASDLANTVTQMAPMFIGGAAAQGLKGIAQFATRHMAVGGWAAAQGWESATSQALQYKAEQKGSALTPDEIVATLQDPKVIVGAFANAAQTLALTYLLHGGAERMALGIKGTVPAAMTVRQFLGKGGLRVLKDGTFRKEISALGRNLRADALDEGAEEALNQAFETFIVAAATGKDIKLGDAIEQWVKAGGMGMVVGAGVNQVRMGGTPESRQQALVAALQRQMLGQADRSMVSTALATIDPQTKPATETELKAARQLVQPSATVLKEIEERRAAYDAAIAAKDYKGAAAIDQEINDKFTQAQSDAALDAADAVMLTRELGALEQQGKDAIAQAEQAVTDAGLSGDKKAAAIAEANLEQVEKTAPNVSLARAAVKLATGQDIGALTDSELRAVGYKPGEDGAVVPMTPKELKDAGMTKPLIRRAADGSAVILDEAVDQVIQISSMASNRIQLGEQAAMEAAQARFDAAEAAKAQPPTPTPATNEQNPPGTPGAQGPAANSQPAAAGTNPSLQPGTGQPAAGAANGTGAPATPGQAPVANQDAQLEASIYEATRKSNPNRPEIKDVVRAAYNAGQPVSVSMAKAANRPAPPGYTQQGNMLVPPAAQPAAAAAQAPVSGNDAAIAGETNKSLQARTSVGTERNTAVTERKAAAIRVVAGLKPGDTVIDQDTGENLTVERVTPGTGEVFFVGMGEPINIAIGLIPDMRNDTASYAIGGTKAPAAQPAAATAPTAPTALEQASSVADSVIAKVEAAMPSLKGRIEVRAESVGSGGAQMIIETGMIRLQLGDIMSEIAKAGGDIAKITANLEVIVIRHELVHVVQTQALRPMWEAAGKPGTFEGFFLDYYATLAPELLTKQAAAVASQIYGKKAWDRIPSNALKAAEFVRMLVEAKLDPAQAGQFSELFRAINNRGAKAKITELIKAAVAMLRKMKLTGAAAEHVAKVEELYNQLLAESTLSGTPPPTPNNPATNTPDGSQENRSEATPENNAQDPAGQDGNAVPEGQSPDEKGQVLNQEPAGDVSKDALPVGKGIVVTVKSGSTAYVESISADGKTATIRFTSGPSNNAVVERPVSELTPTEMGSLLDLPVGTIIFSENYKSDGNARITSKRADGTYQVAIGVSRVMEGLKPSDITRIISRPATPEVAPAAQKGEPSIADQIPPISETPVDPLQNARDTRETIRQGMLAARKAYPQLVNSELGYDLEDIVYEMEDALATVPAAQRQGMVEAAIAAWLEDNIAEKPAKATGTTDQKARRKAWRQAAQDKLNAAARAYINSGVPEAFFAVMQRGRITPMPNILGLIRKRRDNGAKLTEKEIAIWRNESEWNGAIKKSNYTGGGQNPLARAMIDLIMARQGEGQMPNTIADQLLPKVTTASEMFEALAKELRTVTSGKNEDRAGFDPMDDPNYEPTDAEIAAWEAKQEAAAQQQEQQPYVTLADAYGYAVEAFGERSATTGEILAIPPIALKIGVISDFTDRFGRDVMPDVRAVIAAEFERHAQGLAIPEWDAANSDLMQGPGAAFLKFFRSSTPESLRATMESLPVQDTGSALFSSPAPTNQGRGSIVEMPPASGEFAFNQTTDAGDKRQQGLDFTASRASQPGIASSNDGGVLGYSMDSILRAQQGGSLAGNVRPVDHARAAQKIMADVERFKIPVAQATVEAYGLSLPSSYRMENGNYVHTDAPAPASPGRFRPKTLIEFAKPYRGPSGAELQAYEWKHTLQETVDKRGEDAAVRVSNWEDAATNMQTGREIVHQFHVTTQDGKAYVVSLESALKILGYTSENGKAAGPVRNLASMLRTRAQLAMEAEALRPAVEANQAKTRRYEQEQTALQNKRMPKPVFTVEEGRPIMRIGALEKWGTLAGTPESFAKRSAYDLRTLEEEWRREEARAVAGLNGGEYNTSSKLRDIEARIAKMDRKIQEAAAAGSANEADLTGAAPSLFDTLPPGPNAKFNDNVQKAYDNATTAKARDNIANDSARREGMPNRGKVQNVPQAMLDFGMSGSFGTQDQPGLFDTGPNGRPSIKTTDGGTLEAPGQISLFSSPAWHGTPHKVRKFATDKIGTGEGAQAYGWGLYFADSIEVAEGYRQRLSGGQWQGTDGTVYQPWEISEAVDAKAKELGFGIRDRQDAADNWAMHAKGQNMSHLPAFEAIRQVVVEKGIKVQQTGNLYKVTLKVENEDLLDWDKPLTKQREKVKASLGEIGILSDRKGHKIYEEVQRQAFKDKYGERPDAYEDVNRFGLDKEASEKLLAAGIRGIRYLDGNSRISDAQIELSEKTVAARRAEMEADPSPGREQMLNMAERYLEGLKAKATQGSSNYVIFDDADIEITEENGTPVEPAALFSSPAMGGQGSFDFGTSGSFDTKKQRGFDFSAQAPQPETQRTPEIAEIPAKTAIQWMFALRTGEYESANEWARAVPPGMAREIVDIAAEELKILDSQLEPNTGAKASPRQIDLLNQRRPYQSVITVLTYEHGEAIYAERQAESQAAKPATGPAKMPRRLPDTAFTRTIDRMGPDRGELRKFDKQAYEAKYDRISKEEQAKDAANDAKIDAWLATIPENKPISFEVGNPAEDFSGFNVVTKNASDPARPWRATWWRRYPRPEWTDAQEEEYEALFKKTRTGMVGVSDEQYRAVHTRLNELADIQRLPGKTRMLPTGHQEFKTRREALDDAVSMTEGKPEPLIGALFSSPSIGGQGSFDFGTSGSFDTKKQRGFDFSEKPTAEDSSSVQPAAQAPIEPYSPEFKLLPREEKAAIIQAKTEAKAAERAGITDFGEKIGGARKDYAQTFAEAKNLDIASEPFSKVWPEPDYQKLVKEGADPWVIGFVRAMRDEVPTKPRQGWKLSQYVSQVTLLRDMAETFISGKNTKEAIQELIKQPKYAGIDDKIIGSAELYEAVGHGQSLKGIRFSRNHWSLYKGEENVWKWEVTRRAKATTFSNMPQTLAEGNTREEALERFKLAIKNKQDGGKPKIKFEIYRYRSHADGGKPGWHIGKKLGRHHADLFTFETSKEAREYLNENYDDVAARLEAYKLIGQERRTENAPRIGADHRQGRDVTEGMFKQAFGFRGVEFGNSVEQKRRQSDLNRAYESLMDLAAILNIPPQAISLDRTLGLGFGSRGRGGKNAPAAHYEPGLVVINLTKNNGPGSLAHEWFHAMDNYFLRQSGNPAEFATAQKRETWGSRPEVMAAFSNIIKTIDQGGLRKRSRLLDKKRSNDYWSTDVELSARSFENYVIERLKAMQASNDYLANISDISEYAESMIEAFFDGNTAEDLYPYLTDSETAPVVEAFDKLFATIQTKETDRGTALFSSPSPVDAATVQEYLESGGAPTSAAKTESERVSSALAPSGPGNVADDGSAYSQGDFFAPEQPEAPSPGEQIALAGSRAVARAKARTGRDAVSADLISGLQGNWEALAREVNSRGKASAILAKLTTREIPVWNVNGTILDTPQAVHAVMLPIRSPYFESLKVMVLDGNLKTVHSQILTVGSVAEASAHPADILGVLARLREIHGKKYTSIIFSHNHPSGDPSPSRADENVTRRLNEIADIAGWNVMDHIVTNGESYYSFREGGMLGGNRVAESPYAPRKQDGTPVPDIQPADRQAPWEVVKLSRLPAFDTPDLIANAAKHLRNGNPDAAHIFYLNSRLRLLAVERVDTQTLLDDRKLTQALLAGRGREGAYGFVLDYPIGKTTATIVGRRASAVAQLLQMQFIDAVTIDLQGKLQSGRESGLVAEDPAQFRSAPPQPDLFTAATAPDAAAKLGQVKVGSMNALGAYRALTAKRDAGKTLTGKEQQQLLDAETALGQKLAFDMDAVKGNAPATRDASSQVAPPVLGQKSIQQSMFMGPETTKDGQMSLFSSPTPDWRDQLPGYSRKISNLLPTERAQLRKDTAARFVEIYATLPSEQEMGAVALGGIAKRGWYKRSAEALLHVFGVDAPRFAALLAAMSPQTSVESNLKNALNTWKNWVKAGRPTDRESILEIMGQSVERTELKYMDEARLRKLASSLGVTIPEMSKVETIAGDRMEPTTAGDIARLIRTQRTEAQINRVSVLGAWENNTVRALSSENPEEITISGPKVNSFMLNLRGVTNEVTNDAWIANYALIDQKIFAGALTKSGPGKGPGYLAMSAKTRAAAKYLTKLTGEEWTPAEVQETVWSWAKTLYELQLPTGEDRTALQILRDGDLTEERIASTPDFAILFLDDSYRQILKESGYEDQLASLSRIHPEDARVSKPRSAREAAAVDSEAVRRSQEKAAKRLTTLREIRLGEAQKSREQTAGTSLFSSPAPDNSTAIEQALAKMPPKYREVFAAVTAGQTPAQIARQFGVTEKAVFNIANQVRARIAIATKAEQGTLTPRMQGDQFERGRPDLAEGGQAPFVAVDQIRNQLAPTPVVGMEENHTAARKRLAADYEGEFTRLENMARDGILPDRVDIAIAKQIFHRETLSGGMEDPARRTKVALFRIAYRDDFGTEQARALQMRRDEAMPPAERNALHLAELLYEPSPDVQARLKAAKGNKSLQDAILKQWMDKIDAFHTEMKADGYDIKASMAKFQKDKEAREAQEQAVKQQHDRLANAYQTDVDALQQQLAKATAATQAAEAVGLASAEQIAKMKAEAEEMAAKLKKTRQELSKIRSLEPGLVLSTALLELTAAEKAAMESVINGGTYDNALIVGQLSEQQFDKLYGDFSNIMIKAQREAAAMAKRKMLEAPPVLMSSAMEIEINRSLGIVPLSELKARKAPITPEQVKQKPKKTPKAKPAEPVIFTPEQQAAIDAAFERFKNADPATWNTLFETEAKNLTPLIGQVGFEEFKGKALQPWRDRWQTEMDGIANPAGRISFEEWIAKPSTKETAKLERDLFPQPINPTTGTWNDTRPYTGQGELIREAINETTGTFDVSDPRPFVHIGNEWSRRNSTWINKFIEWFKMSILSGLQTVAVNASGALFVVNELGPRRLVEAGWNDMLGIFGANDVRSATLSEFAPMARNVIAAAKLGASNGLQSWTLEQSMFENYARALPFQKDFDGFGSERMAPSLRVNTLRELYNDPSFKHSIGFINRFMRNITFRELTAVDDFNKGIFAQMDVAAIAHRIAAKEEGLKGQAYAERTEELMKAGSLAWRRTIPRTKRVTFQSDIAYGNWTMEDNEKNKDRKEGMPMTWKQASKKAETQSLITLIDAFAASMLQVRDAPFVGPVIHLFALPFINFAANAAKITIEVSPLGLVIDVIDGMRSLKRRIHSGQITKEESVQIANELYNKTRFIQTLTNQTFGAMIFLAIAGLSDDDDKDKYGRPRMTGSTPYVPGKKGVQDNQNEVMPAYSFRFGDTVLSYKRFEPFASWFATYADLSNTYRRNGSYNAVAVNDMFDSIKSQLKEKLFLKSIGDIIRLTEDSSKGSERFVANFITSVIEPNLIRQPIRELDPVVRDKNPMSDEGFMKSVAKRVGYELVPSSAPPKLDAFGDEIPTNRGEMLFDSNVADAFLRIMDPTNVRFGGDVPPIKTWIYHYNASQIDSSQKISIEAPDDQVQIQVDGEKNPRAVALTPAEKAERIKNVGKAAKEMLTSMDDWDWQTATGPDAADKAKLITDTFTKLKTEETRRIKEEKLAAGLPPLK